MCLEKQNIILAEILPRLSLKYLHILLIWGRLSARKVVKCLDLNAEIEFESGNVLVATIGIGLGG